MSSAASPNSSTTAGTASTNVASTTASTMSSTTSSTTSATLPMFGSSSTPWTFSSLFGTSIESTSSGSAGSTLSDSVGSMFGSSVGAYGVNTSGSFLGTRMMPPVEKPPKFGGTDFKRWQQKMLFYLTTLGLAGFLMEDEPPVPRAQQTSSAVRAAYDNWRNGDYLCKNPILNGLDDCLYNVYSNVNTSKALWDALDKKYRSDDTGTKKFVVAKYLDYKMVDARPIMEQIQEFQLIVHGVHAEGMVLPDAFTAATVIEKLPPSWKDFKSYLKHKRKEMTLEDLIVKLRIESDVRKNDQRPKSPIDEKANLLERGGSSNKCGPPECQ